MKLYLEGMDCSFLYRLFWVCEVYLNYIFKKKEEEKQNPDNQVTP